MNREIRVLGKEEYIKNREKITYDYKIIVDDNILIKGYFDKRSKLLKDKSNDVVYVFKSKPSLRLYFYNTTTRKKINIKNDDKYIFVGNKLNIKIEAAGENRGYYLVSKTKSEKMFKYID